MSEQAHSPESVSAEGRTCEAKLWPKSYGFNARPKPCGKRAKVRRSPEEQSFAINLTERVPRWYCGVHDPVRLKAQADARYASYAAQVKRQSDASRRTNACLLACAGISTETLEQGAVRELIEALLNIREWLLFNGRVVDDGITHPAFVRANNAANAALAKVGR